MLNRIIFSIALLSSSVALGRVLNPDEFHLLANSSVSQDGKSLILDSSSVSKDFGWRRYAYAGKDWFLEKGTRYRLTFRVRLESFGDKGRLLVLIRPLNSNTYHYDCGSSTVIPTGGKWKTVDLKFTAGELPDYCIQLHSWNRIKAEISEMKLEKSAPLRFDPINEISPCVEIDTAEEPSGAREFTVDMPRPKGGIVLNVADFGASESNEDNTDSFRKAIAAAKENHVSRLIVPKGVYRFTSDSPLEMKGFSDLTFDGGDSKFISYRKNGPFLQIRDCSRVRFCRFSLDWDWSRTPLASVVKVKSITGKTVDLEFVDYDIFPDKGAFFTCASPLDPSTRIIGLENRVNCSFDKFTCKTRTTPVQWIAPNIARIPKPATGMAVGYCFRLQHYYYHMGGVAMHSNSHLSLENIRIFSTPGHAFRISGTQHHTHFRKVDIVAPTNDARRVITCTADHLHLSNSSGYVKMENCEFSLGGDDIFNMHDNTAFAQKTGDKSLRVLNSPHYYVELPKGTKIELRNEDYYPSGFTGTIEKARRTGPRSAHLLFEENVPGEIGDGFILFDKRYDTHNVIVRDCVFHSNRGRGVLIAARDVTVERNVFRHHESGAIKIETGYTLNNWSEGYGVSNVVVRKNIFDSVNPAGRPASHRQRSVYSGIYMKTDPSTDTTSYPIISDVLFEGNEFRESTGVIAYLTSIKNVTFRDNTFIDKVPREKELDYRSQFYLENARNAKIVNNKWIKSACVKTPGIEWDPGTCENVIVSGNSLVNED